MLPSPSYPLFVGRTEPILTSFILMSSTEPLKLSVGVIDKAIEPVIVVSIVFCTVELLEKELTAPVSITDTVPMVIPIEPVVLPDIVNST
jgi:hypothetical protein